MSIFDASVKYAAERRAAGHPGGQGVRLAARRATGRPRGRACSASAAVIAESYERIHRSNLVGMGIVPLQFMAGENAASLGLTGEEVFETVGLPERAGAGLRGRAAS